jgi:hypothetical protein
MGASSLRRRLSNARFLDNLENSPTRLVAPGGSVAFTLQFGVGDSHCTRERPWAVTFPATRLPTSARVVEQTTP